MKNRVINLTHQDICWGFDGNKPYVMLDVDPYKRQESVDPFPCYSHDSNLVEKLVNQYESSINLKFKPKYFILPFEGESRTNGCACANEQWNKEDEGRILSPYIVLYGKRICLHPAMTRYLTSHELAHVVHYNVETILGQHKNEEFEREYAKIRGIDYNAKYGAQNWHNNIGEIIANDIRIILFNSELEFWQHNVEFPTKNKKLVSYWRGIKKKYLS